MKEFAEILQKTKISDNNMFDVDAVRNDFPILKTIIRNKPLVYLDNAATTQKPQAVIDKITDYYETANSNVHRGVHFLSQKATKEYEESRKIIQHFIGASHPGEVVFTRGTTESINLIASTWGRKNIGESDEIIISHMEHHSNIVPWQMLCEEKGAKLRVIPINDEGELIFDEYLKLINEKTKLVSIVHVSNSLGTINPVKEIINEAHKHDIPVIVDGAQSIQHLDVDVKYLDCDFFAFSGHKIYGPTGIGVLYGKRRLLEEMPPYQGGGDMIASVSFEKTTYNELPYKFEAGTPNIAGAIALAEAVNYLNNIGIANVAKYEAELLDYASDKIESIHGVRLIGTARHKSSVCSFVVDRVHPHDIGTMLDVDGVAVRTGHHCTEPVMKRYCVPATTRASVAFYNTKEEINVLVRSIEKVIKMFS